MNMLRELLLPAGVVAILASMFVPLPSGMIDFLLVGNLILAVVLLGSALYLSDPVKLSSLPTILLLATLYRLALNISTTRLILGSGDVGQMIETFGKIAIQDNLIVGAVVFLVITLVQFIVIAKGAERVAEVSARFTLDALPGKQMSIDADVRSGLIDIETARKKREDLQTESRFYGALDGSMKFVKGDAIAGLVITCINVIGGLAIGVLVNGLEIGIATQKYTLLTIGDGLLSQIPALLNSIAAGMVVTRVVASDSQSLASDVIAQLGQMRKARILAAGVAFLFAILLEPSFPFLVLAGALLGSLFWNQHNAAGQRPTTSDTFEPRTLPLLSIFCPESIRSLAITEQEFHSFFSSMMHKIYEEHGFILPPPVLELQSGGKQAFTLHLRGVPVKENVVETDLTADLLWVQIESLLIYILEHHRAELIDDIMTRRLLDCFDREAPELVSAVIPGIITVTQLSCLLRELAREKISLRNFEIILQVVAEKGAILSDRALLEEVRIGLGRRIVSHFATDGKLSVWLLDPFLDMRFIQAEQGEEPMSPDELQSLFTSLEELSHDEKGRQPILLASRKARRLIYDCCLARRIPVHVLAHEEIGPEVLVEERGWLTLPEAHLEETVERLAA